MELLLLCCVLLLLLDTGQFQKPLHISPTQTTQDSMTSSLSGLNVKEEADSNSGTLTEILTFTSHDGLEPLEISRIVIYPSVSEFNLYSSFSSVSEEDITGSQTTEQTVKKSEVTHSEFSEHSSSGLFGADISPSGTAYFSQTASHISQANDRFPTTAISLEDPYQTKVLFQSSTAKLLDTVSVLPTVRHKVSILNSVQPTAMIDNFTASHSDLFLHLPYDHDKVSLPTGESPITVTSFKDSLSTVTSSEELPSIMTSSPLNVPNLSIMPTQPSPDIVPTTILVNSSLSILQSSSSLLEPSPYEPASRYEKSLCMCGEARIDDTRITNYCTFN